MVKSAGGSIIADTKCASDTPTVRQIVAKLRLIAVHSLARMYRPEEHLFAFRLRKVGLADVLEGVSRRYTAIVLIGLAGEDQQVRSEVIGNHRCEEVCEHLLTRVEETHELGEVALTTWAARILRHPRVWKALDVLRQLYPATQAYPTVELCWALTALVIAGSKITDIALAERMAERLMASFRKESGVFPHGPARKGLAALSSHVSCFADFVYPIQALAHYYQFTKDEQAAEVACRCAERMCQLQGPHGQWWWHFDVRTGRVVERYPVYSVHQDSMAPMALFALRQACGPDYSDSIHSGLRWLVAPPEIEGALVDADRNVIWRKLARREPRKLVRSLQAATSRVHESLRIAGVDALFPPVSIDYETRPYHMGWVLHTWPSNSREPTLATPTTAKVGHGQSDT